MRERIRGRTRTRQKWNASILSLSCCSIFSPPLILSFPFFAEREELLLYIAGRSIDSDQMDLTDDQTMLDLLFEST